uniref:DUF1534 domain-containing protein n=1 Tax=Steinernema glaseri TaxID=37863 RepID=A0A1I7ZVP4_9BILA
MSMLLCLGRPQSCGVTSPRRPKTERVFRRGNPAFAFLLSQVVQHGAAWVRPVSACFVDLWIWALCCL